MPFLLNKSGGLHCGNNNPILQFILDGHPLQIISQFKDLSILRTKRATYRDLINTVAARSSKLCGAILHSFDQDQAANPTMDSLSSLCKTKVNVRSRSLEPRHEV